MRKPQSVLLSIIRWTARIWSVGVVVLLLFTLLNPPQYVIHEGWPLSNEQIMNRVFITMCILGLLLAWRWEGMGGATAVIFTLLHDAIYLIIRPYYISHFMKFRSEFMGELLSWVLLYGIPGAMFILCWLLQRRLVRQQSLGLG